MIQPNNLPGELERFLRKNEALKSYRANLAQFSVRGELPKDKSSWIDYSFIWNKTPQGTDYWDRIDTKWSDYVDEISPRYNDLLIN